MSGSPGQTGPRDATDHEADAPAGPTEAAGPTKPGGGAPASPVGIDPHVPQSARVYDFLLGGKDNYPADRAVGAALIQHVPTLPVMVRAQRAFLARAVRFLARDARITQYLDIGTGIPTAGGVHEIAQSITPSARVVYVDNDPVVLAYGRALMTGAPQGMTEFIDADLRAPAGIMGHPALAATLDVGQPLALLLVGILHHLRDHEDPHTIVRGLVDWLPSGSYLVIAAPGSDFDRDAMAVLAQTAERSGIPYVARDRHQTERFFDGTELLPPGVVPILGWRPDDQPQDGAPQDLDSVFGWAGVSKKP